ncbi:hypothetical protein KAU19_05480 [Candidatus Parcubacteria bacterium]|nr:hypothetical protein [Candidatus Parcubacteria bacterium]
MKKEKLEKLKTRIKFALNIMFNRNFRYKLTKTILYAFHTQKHVRGDGSVDVIEFIINYGDILEI